MTSEIKHERITRALLAEIAAGKFGPTGRLPSEAQLVERFGVSRPTAARALRDLQEQGLVERRVGSGSFVKPRAEEATASRQLGFLVPGMGTTEIFEAIGGELAALARGRGYGLVWGAGRRAAGEDLGVRDAEELCDQFVRSRAAGVFFAPFEHEAGGGPANRDLVERLRREGVAVVLIDRDLAPFPMREGLDLVGLDNFAAGFLAADHLLKLGCRRLAFARRPSSAATVAARVAGAREAMLARGLAPPPDFARDGEFEDPAEVREAFLAPPVEAILCANDRMAAVLTRSLSKCDRRVPDDVRLVGFDDVRYATLLSVPLTTIHQPCRDIAAVAFSMMIERIADPTLPPRTVTLAPRLVVRESCGAYLPRGG
jgi:LacI family transcriptional regulator